MVMGLILILSILCACVPVHRFHTASQLILFASTTVLFPKTIELLQEFGENLRLARLRRNITSALQAERAGISRVTLSQIEKGSPSVSLGSYVQVLVSLGLEHDLLKVAADDELGRKLQDAGLAVRKRVTSRRNK